MTGVYDAWQGGKGYDGVRLDGRQEDPSLFCCYEEVVSDVEKAQKVWNTVHRRMGEESQEMIARAASCPNPEKADAIFRMIVLGLHLPDGRETPRYLSRAGDYENDGAGAESRKYCHALYGDPSI